MTSPIILAAECERDAEQSREDAESAWRAAWWRTTQALAEPSARHVVTDTVDVARSVLGQSRSYLLKRRNAGIVFKTLDIGVLQVLPPRLSIAWAEAHRNAEPTDVDAAEILAAERDGVSLREFAGRYNQTFEPPPTPDEIVQAVRDNPEIAQAIAADDEARETVEEAGIAARSERRPDVPEDIATPDGRADASERSRQRVEGHLGDQTDEATNYLQGAANSLGHALFARDRWGVKNPQAELVAVKAARRLLDIYEAAMESGQLTDEDKSFLESISVIP